MAIIFARIFRRPPVSTGATQLPRALPPDSDEEYSDLNFHTARILAVKIRILRVAILCFLASVLTALPHYLMNA